MIHLDNMERNTKKCNFCGEDVEAGSSRCNHCGSLLDANAESFEAKSEEPMAEPLDLGNAQEEEISSGEVSEQKSFETPDSAVNQVQEEKRADSNGFGPVQGPRGINGNAGYQREMPGQQFAYRPNPNAYGTMPMQRRNPLSNGLKVLLTVVTTVVPGLGQLAGLIIAIIFMNTPETVYDYADRRSFGLALLISCIVIFVLTCLGCFVLALASNSIRGY